MPRASGTSSGGQPNFSVDLAEARSCASFIESNRLTWSRDELHQVLVRADQHHVELALVAPGQGAHDVVGLEAVDAPGTGTPKASATRGKSGICARSASGMSGRVPLYSREELVAEGAALGSQVIAR